MFVRTRKTATFRTDSPMQENPPGPQRLHDLLLVRDVGHLQNFFLLVEHRPRKGPVWCQRERAEKVV